MTDVPIITRPLSYVWEGDKATFAKAFVAAQKSMDAVKKAATNAHFNNKYADLASVIEATVPPLNESGLGLIQLPAFNGDVVTITTIMLHESGSSLTAELDLRPSKNDPQGIGSATTYGRRYALLAMTGTAPEDDDGNASSGPIDNTNRQPTRQQAQKPRDAGASREPTLSERADMFEALLKKTPMADLEKAWAKGSALCAALDTSDPERLVALTKLYENLNDPIPF